MIARFFSRSAVLPATLALLLCSACEPVQRPDEVPGPAGCGMRDPSQTGPSLLSVAQQTAIKNRGMPHQLEDNSVGGKTWIYFRTTGSVFGETEAAELLTFDKDGLLKEQKTEVRRHVGK